MFNKIFDLFPLDEKNNLERSNVTKESIWLNLFYVSSAEGNNNTSKEYLQKLIDINYQDPQIYSYMANILLEENTDFGTDILTSEGINPPENIFRKNENTLKVNHTISHNENAMVAGPLTVDDGVTLTIEGNLTIV